MPRKIRPIRIEGQLAFITLTQGKETVIDLCDLHLVEGRHWCAHKEKNKFYAVSGSSGLAMHRVILGAQKGVQVDHRDGDGLNNRRLNLRFATQSENSRNRGKNSNNKSGFKGVSWNERDMVWIAAIGLRGKVKYLGGFKTPEDAHAAYCVAAIEAHGEFVSPEVAAFRSNPRLDPRR